MSPDIPTLDECLDNEHFRIAQMKLLGPVKECSLAHFPDISELQDLLFREAESANVFVQLVPNCERKNIIRIMICIEGLVRMQFGCEDAEQRMLLTRYNDEDNVARSVPAISFPPEFSRVLFETLTIEQRIATLAVAFAMRYDALEKQYREHIKKGGDLLRLDQSIRTLRTMYERAIRGD